VAIYGTFLPQRWRRQPQYPVRLNRGHPSVLGVIACYNAGSGLIDPNTGASLIKASTAANVVSTEGIAYVANTSGGFTMPDSFRAKIAETGEATGLWINVNGITGNNGLCYFQNVADITHYPYQGQLYFSTFHNSRYMSGGISLVDLTLPHTLVIRVKAGSQKVNQNGLLFNSTSAAAAAQCHATTSILGSDTDSTSWYYRGAHPLFLGWNRFISDAEVQELALDCTRPWQLFAPIPARQFFIGGAALQYFRPISDIAANGWSPSTGGDLYAMLDETVADDGDYIYSPTGPTTEQFEVRLTAGGDPLSSANHTITVRLQAIGADTNFDLDLVQNTTVLDSWTENVTVAAGVVERSRTFSGAVADSITDYSNLRVRGVARA
jgi:hypothetical protein